MLNQNPEKRVSYIPSEQKRFEVSPDPYSRERIKQLHVAYREIRDTIPEISIPFTLGGSLVKGKRLTEEIENSTDIDLFIFIDENDVENKYRDLVISNPKFSKVYHSELTDLEEALKDNKYSTREEREITAAWRTVKEIIYNSLQKKLQNGSTLSHIYDDFYSDQYRIAMTGPHSIMGVLEQYKFERWDMDRFFHQPTRARLAHLFQVDIGGGMKKYIQGFLQDLGEIDKQEQGKTEEEWNLVKFVSEEVERGLEIPENIKHHYPQTFAEACTRYGVKRRSKQKDKSKKIRSV